MKLLRSYYRVLFLVVGVVFISCSSADDAGSGVVEIPGGDADGKKIPVTFNAYTTRETRAVAEVSNIADISALAQVGGFGVFAYEQDVQNFASYSLENTYPNFFNNQQVWSSTQTSASHKGVEATHNPETDTWEYSPIRYYSNNAGALHSFFAYAPYDASAKLVFDLGKAPQIRFVVANDVDLMWAQPTMDKPKAAVSEKILFTFHHALSKSLFLVAPFVDQVHGDDNHNTDTPPAGPDTEPLAEGTTVRVRSVKFLGVIPNEALLNTANGEWTMVERHQEQEVPGIAGTQWIGDGISTPLEYKESRWSKQIPAQGLKIEVYYDVITGTGDKQSHVTNRAESFETFNLEAGKAYKFYLDLGLTTVRFTASVVDWDIPENHEERLWIDTVTCTVEEWEDIEGDAGGIDVGL